MRVIFSEYSGLQWGFFFFFYCFIGWIWECSFCSVRAKKFINRGFMKGPVIPIYGSGAVTLLIAAAPFKDNIILTFFSGMILASLLEYCTGAAMEAIFKVKYWDYSKNFLNINGHICLYASCGWGFATILMTRYVHRPVARLSEQIPEWMLEGMVFIAAVIFIADYTISFKAAWDIRNMLIKMEAIKEEALRIQKRMDVLLAFAEHDGEEFLERHHERIDERIQAIESHIAMVRDKLDLTDEIEEELAEIKMVAHIMRDRLDQLVTSKDIFRRATIKGNPFMVSKRFKNNLEELKSHVIKK